MCLFAIMEHPSLSQSSSTFAIKCSWQIVNMFRNFAELVVVDPCMLCYCSCHVYLAFCVFLMGVCLDCHAILCSECIELVNMPTCYLFCHAPDFHQVWICLCFCYVHMLAIVFFDPFWLMVTKGLLLYALSSFMPCLVLPWYVPVACCYLALNIASWC